MNPLIVSTGDALSWTQAMSYRRAIRRLPGPVPRDERPQRVSRRLGRVRNGRLQVRHDLADLAVVPAAHPVDLLHQLAVLLHQPRVQRIPLPESGQVLHRHAHVQVVGARRQNVLPGARRLGRHRRIDRRVEEQRPEPREQLVERLARPQREARARGGRRPRGSGERVWRARQDELARRQVVVRAGVDPEQLRVPLNLRQRLRIHPAGVREDRLEHVTHVEVVGVALVVEDVAPRDHRLVQVPARASSPAAAAPRTRPRSTCTMAASSTRSSRYWRAASPPRAAAAGGAWPWEVDGVSGVDGEQDAAIRVVSAITISRLVCMGIPFKSSSLTPTLPDVETERRHRPVSGAAPLDRACDAPPAAARPDPSLTLNHLVHYYPLLSEEVP